MPNRFIVKVQLPVVSSEPAPPALVYDRTRAVDLLVPATSELLKKMTVGIGLKHKLFFWAHKSPEGALVLDEMAQWQPW